MEYHCELRSKNVQNTKTIMCPPHRQNFSGTNQNAKNSLYSSGKKQRAAQNLDWCLTRLSVSLMMQMKTNTSLSFLNYPNKTNFYSTDGTRCRIVVFNLGLRPRGGGLPFFWVARASDKIIYIITSRFYIS